MKQLVVSDYTQGEVIIYDLSPDVLKEYGDDFDEYVYNKLDYNEGNTNYIIVNSPSHIKHK